MKQRAGNPVRTVSFVIPHRPEESFEKTSELALKAAKKNRIKGEIIIVSGNQPSIQRNRAVEKAKGDIVFFLDNDSAIEPHSLRKALSVFRADPSVAVVGGPSLTPATDTFIQKCFNLVLSSIFAVGPRIRARYCATGTCRATDEYELILANMAIRRSVFKEVGGFNERMYPNEENILINNIRKKGYKTVYHPEMAVYRSQRKDVGQFVKQMLTYGRGRADQTFQQRDSFNLFSLLPVGFVLYLFFLPFSFLSNVSGVMIYYPVPFILYLVLNVCFSILTALENRIPSSIPILVALYFIVHFFYGWGILVGSIRNLLPKKRKSGKKWFKIDAIIKI
jgi:cellulose synthase/poly-beta-1,6-N-acetylglucosamine synthase-like glycosyltransferase